MSCKPAASQLIRVCCPNVQMSKCCRARFDKGASWEEIEAAIKQLLAEQKKAEGKAEEKKEEKKDESKAAEGAVVEKSS